MVSLVLCLFTLIYEDWEFTHHILHNHLEVQLNFLFLSRLVDYGLVLVIFGLVLGIAKGDKVNAAVSLLTTYLLCSISLLYVVN